MQDSKELAHRPRLHVLKAAAILPAWRNSGVSASLQSRERLLGHGTSTTSLSPSAHNGRNKSLFTAETLQSRDKWFISPPCLGMLPRWCILCYQPYLDHPAPTFISGVFSLFSQDQPQYWFLASYHNHLELISLSLDSCVAVRGCNQTLTRAESFCSEIFCLTCRNYPPVNSPFPKQSK